MKIKLVTFAPHPNFGTCLQSYALNYILRKMGHNVEFIYNGRENPPLTFPQYLIRGIKKTIKCFFPKKKLLQIKSALKHNNNEIKPSPYILTLPNHPILNLLNKIFKCDIWYKYKKYSNLQWKKVYKFTFEDNNFIMRRIYTHKQYDQITSETDLFITGSDQIWNPYCGGYNPMMFLEFADNAKRVAYSSSISQPTIPIEIKDRKSTQQIYPYSSKRTKISRIIKSIIRPNRHKISCRPNILIIC